MVQENIFQKDIYFSKLNTTNLNIAKDKGLLILFVHLHIYNCVLAAQKQYLF